MALMDYKNFIATLFAEVLKQLLSDKELNCLTYQTKVVNTKMKILSFIESKKNSSCIIVECASPNSTFSITINNEASSKVTHKLIIADTFDNVEIQTR